MDESSLLRVVLSLFCVVLLILFAAWVSKRKGWLRAHSSRRIHILSNQRLGARSSLMLIKIDDTELLLGVTPQQINVLHQVAAPKPFSEHLHEATGSE